jgi:hypothetical protein
MGRAALSRCRVGGRQDPPKIRPEQWGIGGLLIDVHPGPGRAKSHGAQSLDFAGSTQLLEALRRLAEPLGRMLN